MDGNQVKSGRTYKKLEQSSRQGMRFSKQQISGAILVLIFVALLMLVRKILV